MCFEVAGSIKLFVVVMFVVKVNMVGDEEKEPVGDGGVQAKMMEMTPTRLPASLRERQRSC